MLGITLVFDSCMEKKFYVKPIMELYSSTLFLLPPEAMRQWALQTVPPLENLPSRSKMNEATTARRSALRPVSTSQSD
jgi:hypothetical protein